MQITGDLPIKTKIGPWFIQKLTQARKQQLFISKGYNVILRFSDTNGNEIDISLRRDVEFNDVLFRLIIDLNTNNEYNQIELGASGMIMKMLLLVFRLTNR